MATSLMSKDCGALCKEEAEFSLKFIITSLELTDAEASSGFDNILVVTTFDGNVFKIENIEEDEENSDDKGSMKSVGRELILQITPEKFAEKLRSCPIMFDLSRGCTELGSYKLDISDCFVHAVKCDDFMSEICSNDLKFILDDSENAKMTLVFQVARLGDDEDVKNIRSAFNTQMKKKNYSAKRSAAKNYKPKAKARADDGSSDDESGSEDNSTNFDYDSDLNLTCETDLCPADEESCERPSTSVPISSSVKSKSTRCCSDIVTSLNVCDVFSVPKTFCNGCGGVSISGITCENKQDFHNEKSVTGQPKTPCKAASQVTVVSIENCDKSKMRICSECFEDLSVMPKGAACPKCNKNSQLQQKLVTFTSEKKREWETETLKAFIREIFMETKDIVMKDWNRLKKEKTKSPFKKTKIGDRKKCFLKEKNQTSKSRCSKVLNARKNNQKPSKSTGLRIKHPGVIFGHRYCQGSGVLVPRNMGWLWNVGISRRGWRPGAVNKTVAKIMKFHLTRPITPPTKPKPAEPATLRVNKKNGEYKIIMNPLTDEGKVNQNYSPIVFKISKSDEEKKRSVARKILKAQGFEKTCECNSIDKCHCLSDCTKARLKYELAKVSNDLCLDRNLDLIDLKDSSESEIDVEFNPPFASKNQCKKPVRVSVGETQYENPYEGLDADMIEPKKPCEDEHPLATKPKTKKQCVPILRNRPRKKKCCDFTIDPCSDPCTDQRFTTNYNPMYTQCPPCPQPCSNSYILCGHQQTFCI